MNEARADLQRLPAPVIPAKIFGKHAERSFGISWAIWLPAISESPLRENSFGFPTESKEARNFFQIHMGANRREIPKRPARSTLKGPISTNRAAKKAPIKRQRRLRADR